MDQVTSPLRKSSQPSKLMLRNTELNYQRDGESTSKVSSIMLMPTRTVKLPLMRSTPPSSTLLTETMTENGLSKRSKVPSRQLPNTWAKHSRPDGKLTLQQLSNTSIP